MDDLNSYICLTNNVRWPVAKQTKNTTQKERRAQLLETIYARINYTNTNIHVLSKQPADGNEPSPNKQRR